jgi:hypothetical protein
VCQVAGTGGQPVPPSGRTIDAGSDEVYDFRNPEVLRPFSDLPSLREQLLGAPDVPDVQGPLRPVHTGSSVLSWIAKQDVVTAEPLDKRPTTRVALLEQE